MAGATTLDHGLSQLARNGELFANGSSTILRGIRKGRCNEDGRLSANRP